MKVSSKNIVVKNSFKDLKNAFSSKQSLSANINYKKNVSVYNFAKQEAISFNSLNSISLKNKINFIKANYFRHVLKVNVTDYESVIHKFNTGVNMFSCSFDLSKFLNIYEELPNYNLNDVIDYRNKEISTFFQNTIYEYENDTTPYYYKNAEGYIENVNYLKNGISNIYLPSYNFNGIGVLQQREGYQIRVSKNLYFKAKGVYEDETIFDLSYYYGDLSIDLNDAHTTQHKRQIENGWYMIGCPSRNNLLISSYFEDLINKNQIAIMKDNNAEAFIPEYNYFGFEYLEPFNGYQIKFQNL